MAQYDTNAELVVIAWLKSLERVPSDKVGADLPDLATANWGSTGFYQVTPVGGSPDVWIPRRRPVVQIACWAANVNNPAKTPYSKTNQMAEVVIKAIQSRENFGSEVSLPTGFCASRIMAVRVETEPQRVPDEANYARTDLDVFVDWMQTEAVTP